MDIYRTGKQYADLAKDKKYDKLKYADADCQAFCELVLKDIGIRDSAGKPYNWKGSNDMARHAVSWIGTKEECIQLFGEIPDGAWAFIWDGTTGREKDRGYFDGLGNYSHIGIYVGNNTVRDSTRYKNSSGQYVRDGVGDRNISAFNRIGLAEMLDFNKEIQYNNHEEMIKIISEIRNKLNVLERMV
jgi:hypothetical protein